MPTIGTFAQLLPARFATRALSQQRLHGARLPEGAGRATIADARRSISRRRDVFVAPSWQRVRRSPRPTRRSSSASPIGRCSRCSASGAKNACERGGEPPAPVIVAGGGIGGLAAALALAQRGFRVKVLEQAAEIGEIGAGIQLAPNAFAAFDALGVGEQARGRAVYTDEMVMMDAVDETLVGRDPDRRGVPRALRQPVRGDPPRRRAPVAARRRARATGGVEVLTSTRVARFEQDDDGVTVFDADGGAHRGIALVGADGVKSAVRAQTVGDDVRVSGHVVYRAVVDAADFPADLRWNAAAVWVGPELPPRPLPAARRRPVQRRRHLPQPRARDLERERRQPRRSAVVLRRHLPARRAA